MLFESAVLITSGMKRLRPTAYWDHSSKNSRPESAVSHPHDAGGTRSDAEGPPKLPSVNAIVKSMPTSICDVFTLSFTLSDLIMPLSATSQVMCMFTLSFNGMDNQVGGKSKPNTYLSKSPSRPTHLYILINRSRIPC